MEGFRVEYSWQFPALSSAESLWPYLSNLNLLFKSIGQSAVKQTSISRESPSDFNQLSNAGFLSYDVWEEQPYHWEYPYRIGTTRNYRIGILESLKFRIDLTNFDDGTIIKVKLLGNARNGISKNLAAFYMTNILRRQLRKTIQHFDQSVQNEVEPYEQSRNKSLPNGAKARISKIKDELVKITRRPRAVKKLIDFIQKAEDWELARIHPYELAEVWGENKYAVLNVFLNAAKLELLDFGWDIICPKCKNVHQHIYKLSELRSPMYCDHCEEEFEIDFNSNVHLVFKPHPLIRKPSDKIFSLEDPHQKSQIVVQQYLNIGDVKYLQVLLDEGTYHIRQGDTEKVVTLHVDERGVDTINVIFSDDSIETDELEVCSEPNITFTNKTHKPLLCTIEKSSWTSKKIHASEIVSQHDFKSLYNDEIITEGQNFKARDLTVLFTDLMDSTSIYQEHGDEMAIGQVMSHFKIIQQIVAEERGSIIKTIGDAVMAVFRNPVNAIKAVDRIQNILSTSTSLGDNFKLKAGIHIGDCTAVNLNNRIDYFGTTVNIASRLVDFASEREIVLSKDVYDHSEVKRFLSDNNDKLFVKESNASLKGFNENEFPIKQIRLEKTKLRLVI